MLVAEDPLLLLLVAWLLGPPLYNVDLPGGGQIDPIVVFFMASFCRTNIFLMEQFEPLGVQIRFACYVAIYVVEASTIQLCLDWLLIGLIICGFFIIWALSGIAFTRDSIVEEMLV